MPEPKLVYVELKTGYDDNGPAWIGYARYSQSGRTVYFNGRAFHVLGGAGVSGNHVDIETGEEYWISGVKKDGNDRLRAGGVKILIDEDCVPDYLETRGIEKLDLKRYEIVALDNSDNRSKFHERLN